MNDNTSRKEDWHVLHEGSAVPVLFGHPGDLDEDDGTRTRTAPLTGSPARTTWRTKK